MLVGLRVFAAPPNTPGPKKEQKKGTTTQEKGPRNSLTITKEERLVCNLESMARAMEKKMASRRLRAFDAEWIPEKILEELQAEVWRR